MITPDFSISAWLKSSRSTDEKCIEVSDWRKTSRSTDSTCLELSTWRKPSDPGNCLGK